MPVVLLGAAMVMRVVHDEIEGLTHAPYDDMKTCCGLWFSMYKKGDHKITFPDGYVTCLPCLVFNPRPYDQPLWRTWP